MTLQKRIEQSAAYIRTRLGTLQPQIGIILGSGLGDWADGIENALTIPYAEIPNFLTASVDGHRGQFVIGQRHGVTVIAMQGRFHYYEGYSQSEVTIPIRAMKQLGIHTLILTNAAGGVNLDFEEGDFMVIRDHINYSGQNPLIGDNLESFGTRFPDMSAIYDPALRAALKKQAASAGMNLHEGVYVMFSGPSFETPAEIHFARTMGADAVGMSTVPEAIVAVHAGLRVLGISCITNMAAGIRDTLSHEDVNRTGARVKLAAEELLDLAVMCAAGGI